MRLRCAKEDLEGKYKSYAGEYRILNEGYHQLKAENDSLRLDNGILQTERHELKNRLDAVSNELSAVRDTCNSHHSSSNTHSIGDLTVLPIDRLSRSLEHQDELILTWEEKVKAANTKREESQAAEASLQVKIKSAEMRLAELKSSRRFKETPSPDKKKPRPFERESRD